MRFYPPAVRVSYKGNMCSQMNTSVNGLKEECYRFFISQVNTHKESCQAQIQLRDKIQRGKILTVDPKKLTLLSKNKKIDIPIDDIQFIQFNNH